MYFLFQDARIQEVTKEFCEWVAGLVSFILISNLKNYELKVIQIFWTLNTSIFFLFHNF